MATELVRPGGRVANVGVHGRSVELKLQDLWIKDIAITAGLVSATTTPMLLRLVAQGKLTPEKFVSHRFTFDSIIDAYDTFGRAAETMAPKRGHRALTPALGPIHRARARPGRFEGL
jgi:alcohol dehydrogenase